MHSLLPSDCYRRNVDLVLRGGGNGDMLKRIGKKIIIIIWIGLLLREKKKRERDPDLSLCVPLGGQRAAFAQTINEGKSTQISFRPSVWFHKDKQKWWK